MFSLILSSKLKMIAFHMAVYTQTTQVSFYDIIAFI